MSFDRMKSFNRLLAENQHGEVPLYNPEAVKKIRESLNRWEDTTKGNQPVAPNIVLGSGTPRSLIYTPLDNTNLDYLADLGLSGEPPFTRGIHKDMYKSKKFTMRQITGFGGPEDTNQRMKFMLDSGATGISVVFDLPTIQMYDSDDRLSLGQVGTAGVAVDSVEDMDLLFKDIPLDEVTVSLVTHYPLNTAILFSMFLVVAERRGIPWSKLKGSVQNDMTLEEVVRSGVDFVPPKSCFRVQCDNAEFISEKVPQWNFITLNGYNLREYGSSAITETAVAIANGMATLEELVKRGHDVDSVAQRLAFFWSIGNDFFEEIARLRAARRIWYKILTHHFLAKNLRSTWMRCHAQTSGVSLAREEPLNNVVRASYHALAAVLGGVQSLHVDSYDEAYSVPTEQAALLSLRTQQVLQTETGITEVVDPLGGSFYVEALTRDLENKILKELVRMEEVGGYVAMVETGSLRSQVEAFFVEEQKRIDSGELKIVGHNCFAADKAAPDIDAFRNVAGAEQRQIDRLRNLRSRRDKLETNKALDTLKDACRREVNILPLCIDAARKNATEGEMYKAFKETFGLWQAPRGI